MEHEILYRPSYSLLRATLLPGDLSAFELAGGTLFARSGACVASSPQIPRKE